jgi:hypothetical protein
MLHNRFGRLVLSAALIGSAALVTVGTAGPASAATGIKCKTLTGNIATTVTLTGCNGNTGKSSKPITSTSLATGGTITWANSKTTTVTLKVKEGDSSTCPAGSTREDAKGTVTADTTGSTSVGHKVKASVCLNNVSGALTLVPGTKASL